MWDSREFQWDPSALTASRSEPPEPRRRRRDGCQVEGCSAALSTRFHKKFHICAEHMKAPCLITEDGVTSRFCQKCSKLEPLSDFDGEKRSCRRALAAHNEARRRRMASLRAAAEQLGRMGGEAMDGSRSSGAGSVSQASGEELGGAVSTDRAAAEARAVPRAGHQALRQHGPHLLEQQSSSMQPASSSASLMAAPMLPLVASLRRPPAGSDGPSGREVLPGQSWGMPSTSAAWQQQAQQQVQPQAHAQAQQQAQAQPLAPRLPPRLLPVPPQGPAAYVSPARMHRMSLKIFGVTPDCLGSEIRDELAELLGTFPAHTEASVRPGCTHLTADLFLGAEGAAAATAVTAQQLAAGLRRAALGSAADSPIVVQWHGQVAASCSSAAGVVRVPAAEPRLLASPACVVAHADEQPQQLLQLQLLPSGAAGSDGHAVLPAAGIVLCRQAGRQVPVEVWGVSAAAAHAALAEAAAAADDGPADSGSDSEAEQVDEQQPAVAQHADLSMGGQQDTLWVRPVGLRAGCCELEVQLPLACPLGGEYGGRGVLLSSAAPLLVLRDAAAAREVQALLECSGQPGAQHLDDLLRDIGMAAAFMEGSGEPSVGAPPLRSPSFVAAAAQAAADFVQQCGGMPATLALLRHAAAASNAAAAADATDVQALAAQAGSSAEAEGACTGKGKGAAAAGAAAGPSRAGPSQAPDLVGWSAPVIGSEAPLAGHKVEELLSQLEREERAGGEQALRPVLPARFLCLQLAVLTAVFLLLVAERLLVQHIWPAPQQG